jgi:hypothetical protein
MAESLRVLLEGQSPDGSPGWTVPFLEAVETLDKLERENANTVFGVRGVQGGEEARNQAARRED